MYLSFRKKLALLSLACAALLVFSPAVFAQTTSPDAVPKNKVTAYYFHGSRRCPTCMNIEAYAREILETAFAQEIAAGSLAVSDVDVELAENRHYVDDYRLVAQSLVLVEQIDGKNGRWKNLDQVWQLVHDKTAFQDYVKAEARAFLDGGSK